MFENVPDNVITDMTACMLSLQEGKKGKEKSAEKREADGNDDNRQRTAVRHGSEKS